MMECRLLKPFGLKLLLIEAQERDHCTPCKRTAFLDIIVRTLPRSEVVLYL